MLEVAGSLWSVPAVDQRDSASRLGAVGLRRLHWDTSDGTLADLGGFTPAQAQEITLASGMTAEAHLMSVRTAQDVDAWAEFCDLVVVHIESEDWRPALDRIERRGATAGLAISPGTPLGALPPDVAVLCMSITPGQAGSAFDTGALRRVASLRDRSPARRIGIDGGVTRHHADAAADAGADWVVVGTDLFTLGGDERWADVLTTALP